MAKSITITGTLVEVGENFVDVEMADTLDEVSIPCDEPPAEWVEGDTVEITIRNVAR